MESTSQSQNERDHDFDPMALDYALGLSSNVVIVGNEMETLTLEEEKVTTVTAPVPVAAEGNSSLVGRLIRQEEQKKRGKVPCKFHDGISGKCWKGKECRFGHELYTGGRFATKHPELSVAARSRREVTCTVNLEPKPNLLRQTRIKCQVTSVVSPSEFYIRVMGVFSDCEGSTSEAMEEEEPIEDSEEEQETWMDRYYFGFGDMDQPGMSEEGGGSKQPTSGSSESVTVTEQLTKYLSFKSIDTLQHDFYFTDVELVAIKKDSSWMRAVVLPSFLDNVATGKIRVQMLDTGEKMRALKKDVCQLPGEFCQFHAEAYKCCLFGLSPVGLVWSTEMVKMFEQLVLSKEAVIVVKNRLQTTSTLFELSPYIVQLSVKSEDNYIDVADKLFETGYSTRWPSDPGSGDFRKPNELTEMGIEGYDDNVGFNDYNSDDFEGPIRPE